jgi:hypothetical protein
VFVRRHVSWGLRRRPVALALLLGALIALAVPAFAAADTFVVNSAGDAGQATGAEARCETESGPLECTFRAALTAANFNTVFDHIVFSPTVFNGEPADTITPATLLPEEIHPVDIDGSECNAGSTVSCLTGTSVVGNGLLVVKAGESKIQHLSVTVASGVVGIRAAGSAGAGPGDEILANTIAMTGTGNSSTGIESKATEYSGEIESFLGETLADSTTGDWKVTFAKAPAGTFVAATQTLAGSTSGLGETKVLAEEPETGSGGGGSGDSTGTGTTTTTQTPPPPVVTAQPAPTKPTVKISKGPKKTSEATTAKFKFTATPAAGATFECKLDAAKWAKCKSPKTYKKLKPGKHTFQVRAAVAGAPVSKPAKYQFTIKS